MKYGNLLGTQSDYKVKVGLWHHSRDKHVPNTAFRFPG